MNLKIGIVSMPNLENNNLPPQEVLQLQILNNMVLNQIQLQLALTYKF